MERTIDDILDIVPTGQSSTQSIYAGYNSQAGSDLSSGTVLDKNQILQEIYREAEEISSRNGSPAAFSPGSSAQSETYDAWSTSSGSPLIDSDHSMDSSISYHPQNEISFEQNFALETAPGKKSTRNELKIVIKKSEIVDQKPPKKEAAKQKKRHQNREAALRYRLKKRAERAATGEELTSLLQYNESLKTQKSNLASEIAYLKGLLSEVHKKKQIRSS